MTSTDYEAVPAVAGDVETSPQSTLVMKFGGTSVADTERLKAVAKRIVAAREQGERVVAVVQPAPGSSIDLATLQEHVRASVAGYKVPRDLVLVDKVVRSPAGKADYRWAKEHATNSLKVT